MINVMPSKTPVRDLSADCACVGDSKASEEIPAALFLAEAPVEIGMRTTFLNRMSAEEYCALRDIGAEIYVRSDETVFFQGERHDGIFLIESGSVRTFYVGPTGREITLAYWTRGHFVGGPEIYGGGEHIWSGVAAEDCHLLKIGGEPLRRLVQKSSVLAAGLLEGSIQKGKCYSALLQMLGTRSVVERLAQLLLLLSEAGSKEDDAGVLIDRHLTHEDLANMVGSTRQWVTATLEKFQAAGAICYVDRKILILKSDWLREKSGM
tara:strand:+ start:4697 stop:5491 length:795 start_codon:yes stop_codon:yes gene_type:complete